jgi:hypothetical protein
MNFISRIAVILALCTIISAIRLIYPESGSILYINEEPDGIHLNAPFYVELEDNERIDPTEGVFITLSSHVKPSLQSFCIPFEVTVPSGSAKSRLDGVMYLGQDDSKFLDGLYNVTLVDSCDKGKAKFVYAHRRDVRFVRLNGRDMEMKDIKVLALNGVHISMQLKGYYYTGKPIKFTLFDMRTLKEVFVWVKTFFGSETKEQEYVEYAFTMPVPQDVAGWHFLGIENGGSIYMWKSLPLFFAPKGISIGNTLALPKHSLMNFNGFEKDLIYALLKDGWNDMLFYLLKQSGSFFFHDGDLLSYAILASNKEMLKYSLDNENIKYLDEKVPTLGSEKEKKSFRSYGNVITKQNMFDSVVLGEDYRSLVTSLAETNLRQAANQLFRSSSFMSWLFLQRRLEACLAPNLYSESFMEAFHKCPNCLAVVILNGIVEGPFYHDHDKSVKVKKNGCKKNEEYIYTKLKNNEIFPTEEQYRVALKAAKYVMSYFPEKSSWVELILQRLPSETGMK